jgi:hypothetical protein
MRRLLRHRRRGQALKGFEACGKIALLMAFWRLAGLITAIRSTEQARRLAVRIAHFHVVNGGRPFLSHFLVFFRILGTLVPYVRHPNDKLAYFAVVVYDTFYHTKVASLPSTPCVAFQQGSFISLASYRSLNGSGMVGGNDRRPGT